MKKETLSKIIAEAQISDEITIGHAITITPPDYLAGIITDVIELDKKLRNICYNLRTKIVTENERHKSELAKIDKEFEALYKMCPHYETTFHGDPSGGNDSYTSCDLCGVEL